MENNKFKVGEICVATAGGYKTRLIQKILSKDKIIYIFDDIDSSFVRTYFEEYLNGNIISLEEFEKTKEPVVEEMTVSEISEKLGKKIKVVAEKNNEDIPF